jgi:hypothetical protein
MKASDAVRALTALARDTFRQSLAHGVFWLLLGVTALCALLCLSVSIVGAAPLAVADESPDFLPTNDPDAKDAQRLESSGVQVVRGEFCLGFGAVRIPLARDARGAVHSLELILAGGVADTLGVLLALMWTAGFLPGFLDARSISVLLAKPQPRWVLLAGKYLGVLVFVTFHGVLFVGVTWLALGVKTGIWDANYLLAAPLFVLHFAIFFGLSAFLAVVSRSTVVCVFGSILFWAVCWGMNYGRHALVVEAHRDSNSLFSGGLSWMAEVGYWVLPKPADLGVLLYNSLDAASDFAQPAAITAVIEQGGFHPLLSVAASLGFTLLLLYSAIKQFELTDY